MANDASFCFKYKARINGKLTSCRIVINLKKKTPISYQVITYIYEGIKIVDVRGSNERSYQFAKSIFFESISMENIHRLIKEHLK